MPIEKQKFYNEIETLPEELTNHVINAYIDKEAPDRVIVKNKEDLKAKLQKGLDDINQGKVYSSDEVYGELDKI